MLLLRLEVLLLLLLLLLPLLVALVALFFKLFMCVSKCIVFFWKLRILPFFKFDEKARAPLITRGGFYNKLCAARTHSGVLILAGTPLARGQEHLGIDWEQALRRDPAAYFLWNVWALYRIR